MSTKTSSCNSSSQQNEVVSKYFVEGKCSMDDSSEFQEPKNSYKGPKTGQANAGVKSKPKRTVKKPKGQKDIRVALKSNKNELIAYSKDFEKVCKTSGIDVDCDHLQLAIALSKSLQQVGNEQLQSSVPSNSQQRVRNIRTTLQEYGFQVPEVKIIKKRPKRIRKNSKLLLITDEERQQIIADRYAQVLIKDLKYCVDINESSNKTDNTTFPLYHRATNTPYEFVRNDSVFYVASLLEVSPDKIGSLLKDWTQIFGRPVSPAQTKPTEIRFWDVQYSQEELDIILSGSIRRAQEVVNSKMEALKTEFLKAPKPKNNHEVIENTTDNNEDRNIQKLHNTQVNISRCGSPDLFDDDVSEDNTLAIINVGKSQGISQDDPEICKLTSNITSRKSDDFMDLTKCVNGLSQPLTSRIENIEPVLIPSGSDNTPNCLSSENIDLTERKSNVYMEMTSCVTVISQKCAENNDNIDLTQNFDEDETENTIIIDDANVTVKRVIENMDLTQSSNSDDDTLPFVQISGYKMDNSCPIAEYKNNDAIVQVDVVIDVDVANIVPEVIRQCGVDVPDTCEIPVLERMSKSSEERNVFEEYEYVHSDQEHNSVENGKIESNNVENIITEDGDIDLTQSSGTSEVLPLDDSIRLTVQENKSLGKKDDISIDYDEVSVSEKITDHNIVRSNVNNNESIVKFIENIVENHSIVIDHDIDNTTNRSKNNNEGSSSSTSIIGDEPETFYSNIVSDVGSEVLEISDEELNYSMHKSKFNNTQENVEYETDLDNMNFDMGGVSSLLQNMSSFQANSTSTNSLSISACDSILPEVEIKGTKVEVKTPETPSTSKTTTDKDENLVQTPSNREYIIKTSQVTPMVDYESMSTPARNEELEKYGLKPFKRKRAIKLLTHLYNQTHPIVQNCIIEDLPSSPKRHKPNIDPKTTPTKSNNPAITQKVTKEIESPKKVKLKNKGKSQRKDDKEISDEGDDNIENKDDYEETNCRPDIRDLDNGDTDWVFQKKEKAKVHSCRVPLHIAFHNYVATRTRLRNAILRYEPVNIDVIHKQLVTCGHRYDPKDLLRFLDKKCITVKTADNNTRNAKRSQKKS